MFINQNRQIRSILYAIVLIGVVYALGGINFRASAQPGAEGQLIPAVVSNDDFDNALIVTGFPYSNTQDIFTATVAADDPSFPCLSGQRYNTVWYSYTPAADDILTFTTYGSQYSAILGVWTGSRGSLTNRACFTSQGNLAVTSGTTYYLEVARTADTIIPPPTTINIVLSIWSASTLPEAFNKTSPDNGNARQSTRPILTWSKSLYTASYAYCFDTSNNETCDTSWISTTSTSVSLSGLSLGTTYYWQVRATNSAATIYADANTWWSFATASSADLNHWTGLVSGTTRNASFDVFQDAAQWLNISVTIPYNGCNKTGNSTILVGGPGAVTNRIFSYSTSSGSFRFNGTFTTLTAATGTYQLNNYPVCVWTQPGYCCYAFTSGSGVWTASGPQLTPQLNIYIPLLIKD